jgi:3-isopropylmalate dehydratase small subunit
VGLKAVGIRAVVAKSFARIFYRSAINQGLILIECPEAVDAFRPGDGVEVDPENGIITIGGREFRFPKLPPEIIAIRNAGGLLAHVRKELQERGTP